MSENQDKRNVAGRLPPAGADVGPVPSPGVPVSQRAADVGRAPSHGGPQPAPNAASGDAAYNDASFESGEALLARILTERRQNWQGRGKYKEPDAPDTAKLSPLSTARWREQFAA